MLIHFRAGRSDQDPWHTGQYALIIGCMPVAKMAGVPTQQRPLRNCQICVGEIALGLSSGGIQETDQITAGNAASLRTSGFGAEPDLLGIAMHREPACSRGMSEGD